MATTATGTTLTQQQLVDQAAVRNAAIVDVLDTWPLLSTADLDGTFPAWARSVMRTVATRRQQSAQTAADYYAELRGAELARTVAPHPVRLAAAAAVRAVSTSLLVTGPVGIKTRLGKGIDPDAAKRTALVEVSGAVTRHVLDGGRQTLVDAVESDAEAVGFARVARPSCCAFCAMLASRGFAYKTRESAVLTGRRSKLGAGQQYHDHCRCTVEPAFGHGTPLPASSRRFSDLWASSTRGTSGKAAMAAFRQAHEAVGADSAGPERHGDALAA